MPIIGSEDLFFTLQGYGYIDHVQASTTSAQQQVDIAEERGLLSAIDDLSGGMFGQNANSGGHSNQ